MSLNLLTITDDDFFSLTILHEFVCHIENLTFINEGEIMTGWEAG